MKLSPIWQLNVRRLRELRDSDLDALGVLHLLQAMELFAVNSADRELQQDSARLWLGHLNGSEVADRLLRVGESEEYNDSLCFQRDGLRLSLDFLKKVNTAVLAAPYVGPAATVLEVGGGFGQLARIMIKGGLCRRYILVDLPDTLHFARAYLSRECPGADVEYVAVDQWAKWSRRWDLRGLEEIDCFVNTSSLGEMRREVATDYVQKIQRNSRACVLLNRMLNCYHPIKEYFREQDSGWYWALDPYWQVDMVKLEPAFTRFPYESMLHHRELLFCATRVQHPWRSSVPGIHRQSWLTTTYRSASNRALHQFLHDGEDVTRLLEWVRTHPDDQEPLDLLIRFLHVIALRHPFEELPHLFGRYRELAGVAHPLEPSWLRRAWRSAVGGAALRAYQLTTLN